MKKTFLVLLLLLIGISFGVGLNKYSFIPLEKNVNIVDLITLLVTLFLAIYIPMFLQKHLENRRYEKEVIIKKIESLQSSFKEVNMLVTECVQKNAVSSVNCHNIINCFTAISNELGTLVSLVEYCKLTKFNSEMNELRQSRKEYKDIVTGGNFQRKNFKYTALTKKEEEVTFNKIDKSLCLLILKINSI